MALLAHCIMRPNSAKSIRYYCLLPLPPSFHHQHPRWEDPVRQPGFRAQVPTQLQGMYDGCIQRLL